MLPADQLADVLQRIPLVAVDRSYARRVFARTALGLTGTTGLKPGDKVIITIPSFLFTSGRPYRFNPDGIETLYVGEGETVAGAEVKQQPGATGYDQQPRSPDFLYHVAVKLSAVLDVTDPSLQRELGTTAAELLSNWRLLNPSSPTQILGREVFNSGRIEGLRYQSAAQAKAGMEGFCVALFRSRKLSGSNVHVFDDNGTFDERW